MTVEQALVRNPGSDLEKLHLQEWLVLILFPLCLASLLAGTVSAGSTVLVKEHQTTLTVMIP